MWEYMGRICFAFHVQDCLHSPFEIVSLFLLATLRHPKKSGKELRQATPWAILWVCEYVAHFYFIVQNVQDCIIPHLKYFLYFCWLYIFTHP